MYIIYHLASIFLVFVTVLKKARPSDHIYYRCHSQGMRRPGWHTCASKAGEKGVRDIICGANARIARKTNDVGANVSFVRGRQTLSYRMPPILSDDSCGVAVPLGYLDQGTNLVSLCQYI